MSTITENSPVALGILIASAGIIAGAGISWGSFSNRLDTHDKELSTLDKKHAEDIARVETRQVIYVEKVASVDQRLAVLIEEIRHMRVSMKNRDDKEVASRAGAPKVQCTLYNPCQFSMSN